MLYGVMPKSSTLTAQNILTKHDKTVPQATNLAKLQQSILFLRCFQCFSELCSFLGFIASFTFLPTTCPSSTIYPNTFTYAIKQYQSWASPCNSLHDSWSNMRPPKRLEQNTDHNFTRYLCLASQLFCMCCFRCFPASDLCILLILRTCSINSYVMYLILLFDIISFVWTLSLSLMYHLCTSFNMFQPVPLGHLHDLQKLKGPELLKLVKLLMLRALHPSFEQSCDGASCEMWKHSFFNLLLT